MSDQPSNYESARILLDSARQQMDFGMAATDEVDRADFDTMAASFHARAQVFATLAVADAIDRHLAAGIIDQALDLPLDLPSDTPGGAWNSMRGDG